MSCLHSSEMSAAAIASAHISAQPRQARLCDLFRSAVATLHKSHRLAKARIKAVAFVFLSVGLCQSRKDPYLPLEPQCVRLLPRPTGLPPMAFAVSFRIRFADAKTAVKHHRPTHILPLEHHLICNLISRPKDSSQVVSIAKECILRLSPPDAFIEQVKFCNLLYDIYLLCGMDVLKTCNQLA